MTGSEKVTRGDFMIEDSQPEGLDPLVKAEIGAVAGRGHAPEAVQTLKQAMRRARFDDAERIGVLADQLETKIGRLELLHDALRPMLAQVPKNVDLFDVGVMPGSTPRLFIDMIGFVEMGRDARVYRFLQDTRHNRITLAESTEKDVIVEAITNYVARRLLEREKALASDALDTTGTASASPSAGAADIPAAAQPDVPPPSADATAAPTSPAKRGRWRGATRLGGIAFAFLIDLLGAIAFFTILAVAAWLLYNRLHGQV